MTRSNPKQEKRKRILRNNNAVFCDVHNEQAFYKNNEGVAHCFKCEKIKKADQMRFLHDKRMEIQKGLLAVMKEEWSTLPPNERIAPAPKLSFSQSVKKINYGKERKG